MNLINYALRSRILLFSENHSEYKCFIKKWRKSSLQIVIVQMYDSETLLRTETKYELGLAPVALYDLITYSWK